MHIEYFQLIDEILEIQADSGLIRTRATIPDECSIFEGHFPGHPLMPGVLLIEAMAQTSGYLLLSMNGFSRMPFLAGVREAKLRTFVTPGDILDLEARMEHDGSGYAMTMASVKRGEEAVCESRLTFRVLPFPKPEFKAVMTENAVRMGYPEELVL